MFAEHMLLCARHFCVGSGGFRNKASRTKEIFIIPVQGGVVRRKPLRKLSLHGDGKKAHE